MSALTVPDRALRSAVLALLLPLLIALPTLAHNGAVAIAVPVEGITVDGDLSDWPQDMRRYPIALPEYGVRPRDASDFQGSFRVGYNAQENALYVAVEVQDESSVIDTTVEDFYMQEGCDVYVDVGHQDEDSPVAQYMRLGEELEVYGAGGRAEDARVGVQRGGGKHRYEWRIDVGGLSRGTVQLAPGMVLGLDVVVNDADGNGSFSWMAWGRGIAKVTRPENRGDAVLVAADAGTGTLRVRTTREEAAGPAAGSKVQARFLATAGQWVDLVTDREGLCSVELPAGKYRVAPVSARGASTEGVAVTLEAGGAAEVELAVPVPRGVTVTAGKGKLVKSGPGTRQGSWLTYDASDGLPSARITAICRDGHGGLWLSTVGGAVHFDGARYQILTTKDGLPRSDVLSIARDRQGHLWFGFWQGGVSRYDGQGFITFTTEDGLSGNTVRAICEDREGNLWFGIGEGGASRYDGQGFTTYGAADGLAGLGVEAIFEDRQGNLWFGTWGAGVSRYDGQGFTTYTTVDGLASNDVMAIAEDRQGNLWFATLGGASRFDGQGFTTFTTADGLAGDELWCVAADGEGGVWFGSRRGGVSRWDGQRFVRFTARDGLAAGGVWAIAPDEQGGLWFGTTGGLSRYDGAWITSFTTEDGLAEDQAYHLLEDRQGNLWFAGNRGVSRYDGSRFATFAAGEGLPGRFVSAMRADGHGNVWVTSGSWASRYDGQAFTTYLVNDRYVVNAMAEDRHGDLWFVTWGGGVSRFDGERLHTVRASTSTSGRMLTIAEDRDGNLWFGTEGEGVWRYDGEQFTTYTSRDGLASDTVRVIHQDQRGSLWFGTSQGVSRFDGREFAVFTIEDGLAGNQVQDILEDREGDLWFSTDGGATRYDGETFTSFTTEDGLVHNAVRGILEDREGDLWFYTPGGVSRYDGRVFQRLRRQDGLVHNGVTGMLQDRSGDIWITTLAGVTRYRPRSELPRIELTDVVADRRYGPVPELRLPSSQNLVAFEFQGASLTTGPGQMVYLYRLEGRDPDWRVTREPRVEYANLAVGDYSFQVQAADRDLNYSAEPAEVRVSVHLPYGQVALIGGLGLALIGVVVAGRYGIRRRRERDLARTERDEARERMLRELGEELQTAHDMQMGLMPAAFPEVTGFAIAGRCVSANHVGGDFYQYFERNDGLAISLADVTGHAMEAAIPAVMFSGILDNQMEQPKPLPELFQSLNRSLNRSLGEHTYVCLSMLDLDPAGRRMRVANCGCPYPLHYRQATGQIEEIQVEAYPLGIRPDTEYAVREVSLSSGDYVVLHSDGFSEATNSVEQLFGFDRTMEVVRQGCSEGLSPEALIERLIGEVKAFTGGEPQADDMTCVVVHMKE